MVLARLSLEESYPVAPESVRTAREAVVLLAIGQGVTGNERLDAIRLAVSEAVTNAVVHAYPGGGGHVEITAGVAGRELWILVADRGRGFQTRSATPGAGLGMPLMATVSDDFAIVERSGGGTEVRMRFQLDAELSLL